MTSSCWLTRQTEWRWKRAHKKNDSGVSNTTNIEDVIVFKVVPVYREIWRQGPLNLGLIPCVLTRSQVHQRCWSNRSYPRNS